MNLTDLKHRAIAQWRQTGPVTRALCLTMLVLNILLSWVPASLGSEAVITPFTVPGARLPAVLLDGLVVIGAGFTGLLLTLAIVAWLNQARLRQLWQRDQNLVIGPAVAVLVVAAVLLLLLPVAPPR